MIVEPNRRKQRELDYQLHDARPTSTAGPDLLFDRMVGIPRTLRGGGWNSASLTGSFERAVPPDERDLVVGGILGTCPSTQ